eukprot:2685899-Ditylum_brightwellii.AAC.1
MVLEQHFLKVQSGTMGTSNGSDMQWHTCWGKKEMHIGCMEMSQTALPIANTHFLEEPSPSSTFQ